MKDEEQFVEQASVSKRSGPRKKRNNMTFYGLKSKLKEDQIANNMYKTIKLMQLGTISGLPKIP